MLDGFQLLLSKIETAINKTLYTLILSIWFLYTGGVKKNVHILRDAIYALLLEVELNYGSNV